METIMNPPTLTKKKLYEQFKAETLAWAEITELDKEKQAIAVALNLPEDDEQKIRERVFGELDLDNLKRENGLSILFEFLDKHLRRDELTDLLEKIEEFDMFERGKGQSINDYVAIFDLKYRKVQKKCVTIPSEILAFRLMNRANITKTEQLLIVSGLNYEDRSSLYEQAIKLLKKFKGGLEAYNSTEKCIKLEPAYLASGGYVKPKPYRQFKSKQDVTQVRGDIGIGFREEQTGVKHKGIRKKRINPLGANGQTLKCISCGSFRHLLDACPDSWENMEREDSRLKPLSLSENKNIECEKELKGISVEGETQLTFKHESNIPADIAELAAEVVSLRKEILSLKEELKVRTVNEGSLLKRQTHCSKVSQKAKMDQIEEKQKEQTEMVEPLGEELSKRFSLEKNRAFKGSEMEPHYLQNKILLTELEKEIVSLTSQNENLLKKCKELEDKLSKSKQKRENSLSFIKKQLLDDSLGQDNHRYDLGTWIHEKLGVSLSDIGDKTTDLEAEWDSRSRFKRENSRNQTRDKRKNEKLNESEARKNYEMGQSVKQLQRAEGHLKKTDRENVIWEKGIQTITEMLLMKAISRPGWCFETLSLHII